MTTDLISTQDQIQSRIFTIRGTQVMLDRDLAQLYEVELSQMNRQVKRNISRFPSDFMFQLTKDEWEGLKCQNGISNSRGGDRRNLPYAFTEQGVSMLSGILRTPIAIQVLKVSRQRYTHIQLANRSKNFADNTTTNIPINR